MIFKRSRYRFWASVTNRYESLPHRYLTVRGRPLPFPTVPYRYWPYLTVSSVYRNFALKQIKYRNTLKLGAAPISERAL